MKFIKLLIAAIVLPAIMYAQQQAKESSAVLRTIEVIGAASTSLPPNIVNVNFVIKEYTEMQKLLVLMHLKLRYFEC
jgi:uncharacterized protein YggE